MFIVGRHILFAALLALLLSPSASFAQETAGASAGTLTAAALETVGYVAQAQVLDQLGKMLDMLGALVLICSLISAILTIALFGEYRTARWFLVGPVLFFFLTKARVTAYGSEWRFGVFDDKQAQNELAKQLSASKIATESNVSYVFHRYNVLVSSIVQNLIKVITSEDQRRQMKFMARQNLLDAMYKVQLDNSGLIALTQFSMSHCADLLHDARLIADGERNISAKRTQLYYHAVNRYCTDIEKRNIALDKDKPWTKYIVEIHAGQDWQLPERASCHDLWKWQFEGARRSVLAMETAQEKVFIPSAADQQIIKEIRREIGKKITEPESLKSDQGTIPKKNAFKCENGAGKVEVEMNNEQTRLATILAGYLLKRTLVHDPRSNLLSDFAEHAGIQVGVFDTDQNDLKPHEKQDITRRGKIQQYAESKRVGDVFTIAMVLPHMQGLGLYVLGLCFPFFALVVIVPGKASSFFLWMALWAWLKSWDVGFALIMVVDDILWEFMPKSAVYLEHQGSQGDSQGSFDPVSVFEMAFQGDHAYNLSTYYTLIGSLICAVPVVTAEVILGTKKAIAGVMMTKLMGLGQMFSGPASDYVATRQAMHMDKIRTKSLMDEAFGPNGENMNMPFDDKMANEAGAILGDLENAARQIQQSSASTGQEFAIAGAAITAGVAMMAKGNKAKGADTIRRGLMAAGLGTAAGGIGFWGAGKSIGLRTLRQVNNRIANYRSKNISLHYWDTIQSKKYRDFDEIRAGLSLRGEWWIVPEGPLGVREALSIMKMQTETDLKNLEGARQTLPVAATVEGIKEGAKALNILRYGQGVE